MKKTSNSILGEMNNPMIYKNITDFSKGLVRVGDIENDGTPLVVCYYRPDNQQYILSLWVDCLNSDDRWIFVSAKSSDIIAYMNKDISMHRIVVDERPNMILSFSKSNQLKNNLSLLEQFPEDCSTDYYFDSNYCKEERLIRQFIGNNP